MMDVLVIDNYDSFTFNLVHYLEILGAKTEVYRNDALSLSDTQALSPQRILISPGPCTPNEAGISMEIIQEFGRVIPILGVCLGHQCIGQVYGSQIIRAQQIMHGKTSPVFHEAKGLFRGLESPFTATRYHSLVIDPLTLSSDLEVTAKTEDGVIMAIAHKKYPVYGVQFHPESIASDYGFELLRNFITK